MVMKLTWKQADKLTGKQADRFQVDMPIDKPIEKLSWQVSSLLPLGYPFFSLPC